VVVARLRARARERAESDGRLMDASEILQLATLISVLAGVIGVFISIRAYQRQIGAQFLLEYTRRVDTMLATLPSSVWGGEVFGDQEIPPPSNELRIGVLRCLNVFAQLYFFSRRGYIPKHVWRRNREVFAHILSSPVFVREWQVLAPLFVLDRPFCRYMERAHRQLAGGTEAFTPPSSD
jgi:hypothetical protein